MQVKAIVITGSGSMFSGGALAFRDRHSVKQHVAIGPGTAFNS